MAFFNGNGGEREEGWVSLSVYTYLKDTTLKATMFMEKKKKTFIYYETPQLVLSVCAFMHLHFMSLHLRIPRAFTCIFLKFLNSFHICLVSAEVSV